MKARPDLPVNPAAAKRAKFMASAFAASSETAVSPSGPSPG